MKNINLTEDEFYEKYNPIKNHFYSNPEDCSFDGSMFETYGEEVKFVENLANTPEAKRSVWTIIEAEGNLYFVSGYHYVNRFGYLITSELVEEGIEIEVALDNEMDS